MKFETKDYNTLACIVLKDNISKFTPMLIDRPNEPLLSASDAIGVIAGTIAMCVENPENVKEMLGQVQEKDKQTLRE